MESYKARNIYTAFLSVLFVVLWISGRWTESYQVTTFYIELVIVTIYISRLPINRTVFSLASQHKTIFLLLLVFVVFYIKILLYQKTDFLIYALLLIYSLFFVRFSESLKQSHVLFVLIFLLLISVSFFFSPLELSGRYYAQHRFEQTVLHALVFLVLISEFRRKALNPKILLSTIILSLTLVFLEYTFKYVSASVPPTGFKWWSFPPCCFHHTRHFGYLGTAAAAVLLGFIVSLKHPFKRSAIPLWMLLTFSLMTLIWSGGRAATGSVILTMVALLILIFLSGYKTQKIPITIGFITSFLVATAISAQLHIFPWNGLTKMLSRTATAENLDRISSGRLHIWNEVLQAWTQSPLFGLGSHAYAYTPKSNSWLSQPHSMIFQFLLEWGILGIIVLIIIYATYAKYMFLHISNGFTKMSPSVLAASCTIFALGIHGLVDGTWYYPQPVFTQILCFAVVMGELKATKIRPSNS